MLRRAIDLAATLVVDATALAALLTIATAFEVADVVNWVLDECARRRS